MGVASGRKGKPRFTQWGTNTEARTQPNVHTPTSRLGIVVG